MNPWAVPYHSSRAYEAHFSRRYHGCFRLCRLVLTLLVYCTALVSGSAASSTANRLTYLDDSDPFYVGLQFPKLTTPQWVGEPGVETVVILAVDDMTESKNYEVFLRPILERLKEIDGRAPVSIMTRSVPVADEQVQKWLKEGLSLEVHTIKHPCPLLANGDFEAATATYNGCIDLLNQIAGNKPVAFRMPCCDSMNSPSPRFYAEMFNSTSSNRNFLTIDSSVMNRFTTNDTSLPQELMREPSGRDRFLKYFPAQTNAITRVPMGAFATTIDDYPYPYVIGKLCWEFPCAAPSDWEAHNFHGSTNDVTVADWKAELQATVLKQGVLTMVFHPHGWIRNEQMVEFINYAVSKYGKKVKFLTFPEAQQRLDQNLLAGQPLRAPNGKDNGVRLLDLNQDGFLDVVIGNAQIRKTRIWDPAAAEWKETTFPAVLVSAETESTHPDAGVKFGVVRPDGAVTAFYRNETSHGAWYFDGAEWRQEPGFFSGLNSRGLPVLTTEKGRDRGVRLRDVDDDGRCELLVGNDRQNGMFDWSETDQSWKQLPYGLPADTSIVNAAGEDNGLRFVDLNGDGHDDLLFSNENEYSVHIFIAKPVTWLGWEKGWSYRLRSGKRGTPRDIPMIVRAGAHRNNGAWFHGERMIVQNEDTASLPDKVAQVSFAELQTGDDSPAKSPEEGLAAFRLQPGFKIELVASEPLVIDPVALDWGPDGKLWVVEMRDYPLGMDGKGKAGGVVKFLEDTKGTGRYDKSTIFLEGLNFPNGIMSWHKGVLISAAPDIIYAEDTDGDGKADIKKVLYTGFHEGNQQHRINGFEYGLDNWVYMANGGSGGVIRSTSTGKELNLRGHDLRIRPDDGVMELQPGQTQFGRHRDDWGNWFGNDNPRWVWHYFLPEHYLSRNPDVAVRATSKYLPNYPSQNRIFAASKAQQRFNWPNAIYEVTSACSASPYRDDLFGPEFANSLFVCEPANNVVHREILETEGVTFSSHRGEQEKTNEFLASSDNWCRPVMVKTGPDGALYVADVYRLIIEHPEYFPEELKTRPDLRAGEDKGRIYRIYPAGATLRKIPRLDQLDVRGLVAALDSANGWQRDTVQRLLVQARDKSAVRGLQNLLKNSQNPKVRLQALSTLDGLQAATPKALLSALKDQHYAVRRHAIELSEPLFGINAALDRKLFELVDDPDIRVRYQLAFSLGESKSAEAGAALARLARKDWADENMQTAILSSAVGHIGEILSANLIDCNNQPPPASLTERFVGAAVAASENKALAGALNAITEPLNAGFADWQLAGVAGLMNALEVRQESLASGSLPEIQKAAPRLETVFTRARVVAMDPNAAEPARLLAIRLLGRSTVEKQEDIGRLGELLAPQNSSALQKAAIAGLRRNQSARCAEVLLEHWKTSGLNQRQEILNILLTRQEWTEVMLKTLEQGALAPEELGAVQRQKLLKHASPAVRERSEKIFAAIGSDRQKVLEQYKGVAELKGDPAKGHVLFTQNCSICHRLKSEGQSIGPDLGTVATKPVSELLVAILDPNQAIDPAYTGYSAITKDDRELSGILVAETPNSISLRMAGGAEESLLRSNLVELKASTRSLMPEGFETALKPQDMADLLVYILNSE